MKKCLILLASCLIAYTSGNAQLSSGGFPWSITQHLTPVSSSDVHRYSLPDWNAYLQTEREESSFSKPPLVALFTPTDISFPSSGNYYPLDNGDKVWSAEIEIQDALGMGFYFDRFSLPKGVTMYITNGNKKHILGGYDISNTNDYNNFATEAVQGGRATLELNIASFADEQEIQLHLDRIAVYFRSAENLARYADDDLRTISLLDEELFKTSSVCAINAICPLGSNYADQRKATVQQLIPQGLGLSVCSGTMVNKLGNTSEECTQYYLTAGHCESTGQKNDAVFSQLLLRFQFETTECYGTQTPEAKTLTGARFISRSAIPSNASNIKGDFLLLLPISKIPASWGVLLNGWDARPTMTTTNTDPEKFINFSHPAGDVKKVFAAHRITSAAVGAPGSHWLVNIPNGNGVVQQGSSGSGLFEGSGQLIGIASVAGAMDMPQSCNINGRGQSTDALNYIYFSKLSYNWNYAVDGNVNNAKLKPWLDPNNTGNLVVNTVTTECQPLSGSVGITNTPEDLSRYIHIFPNPTTDGHLKIAFNLAEATSGLQMEIIDVLGRVVKTAAIPTLQDQMVDVDLSNVANGMYTVKIFNSGTTFARKVVVSK
ncbi:MAG: hypothetical protein BGO09_03140 [Bacteroidetes bacterium 47-18]|nr:MAG: hypothetical protein BGO09_03140 [Bacteroidetes bacterium 47-18]